MGDPSREGAGPSWPRNLHCGNPQHTRPLLPKAFLGPLWTEILTYCGQPIQTVPEQASVVPATGVFFFQNPDRGPDHKATATERPQLFHFI